MTVELTHTARMVLDICMPYLCLNAHPDHLLGSEVVIMLRFQLCSGCYIALNMKNSIRSISVVTMEIQIIVIKP